MTKLALTHAHPVLLISDMDAALDFYTAKLGFTLDWRTGDTAAVSGEAATLFLKTKNTGALGPVSVILNVEDADAVYAAWQLAGVNVASAVETKPWGMREFDLVDPDGNLLTVGHVDETQADYSEFELNAPDNA